MYGSQLSVFDLLQAMNGSLAGLVSITSACGVVEPWAAVVIGGMAGVLYLYGSKLLVRLRLDDAVDAIPVHMFNGIFGMLMVGFFASPRQMELTYGREMEHAGVFYGSSGNLLGAQCVGILFILGWIVGIMMPFFIWLDWKGWFRSDPLEEIVGLDTSYHGGLILSSGEGHEQVNPEYISQFKQQRAELRQRKVKNGENGHMNGKGTYDDVEGA